MSIGPRARQGRELCMRLAEEVALIAVPGIGRWGEAWEIVAEWDTDFMVALLTWERMGDEEARLHVRDAYDRVLDAWREAARQYQEETA